MFTLIDQHGRITTFEDAIVEIRGEDLEPVFMPKLTLRLLNDRTAVGNGEVRITNRFLMDLIPYASQEVPVDPWLDLRISISQPGQLLTVTYPGLLFQQLEEIRQLDAILDTRVQFVCRWQPGQQFESLNFP